MPPFLDEDEQDFFLQLAYAASHGATDELASVLKSGSVFLSSMDTDGRTLIHHASKHGHTETLKMLMDLGCDCCSPDRIMWTPLHLACKSGHLDVVNLLLKSGVVPVEPPDRILWTPLHCAAARGWISIGKVLLAKSAESRTQDQSGRTAGEIARAMGHTEFADLCQEHADRADERDRATDEAEARRLETEQAADKHRRLALLRQEKDKIAASEYMKKEGVKAAEKRDEEQRQLDEKEEAERSKLEAEEQKRAREKERRAKLDEDRKQDKEAERMRTLMSRARRSGRTKMQEEDELARAIRQGHWNTEAQRLHAIFLQDERARERRETEGMLCEDDLMYDLLEQLAVATDEYQKSIHQDLNFQFRRAQECQRMMAVEDQAERKRRKDVKRAVYEWEQRQLKAQAACMSGMREEDRLSHDYRMASKDAATRAIDAEKQRQQLERLFDRAMHEAAGQAASDATSGAMKAVAEQIEKSLEIVQITLYQENKEVYGKVSGAVGEFRTRAEVKQQQEIEDEENERKKEKAKKMQVNIQKAKLTAQTAMRLKLFEEEGRNSKSRALVMLQAHIRRYILRKQLREMHHKAAALEQAVLSYGVKATEKKIKSMARKDLLVAREENVRKIGSKAPEKRTEREVKQLADMLSKMNCFRTFGGEDISNLDLSLSSTQKTLADRNGRLEALTHGMHCVTVTERLFFTEKAFHLLRRIYGDHKEEHEVLSQYRNCYCVMLTGCLLGLEVDEESDAHGWEKKPSDEQAEQQLLEQSTVLFKAGQSFNTKTLRLIEPSVNHSWGTQSKVTMLVMQAHQYKWFSSKDGGPFPPESAQGAEHMTAVPIFEDCEEKFVNSLSRHLLKCEVKKGDYLARAGEIGDKMWLVRKGSVDFVDPSGSVVHSFAAHMADGAWKSPAVGERALVEDAPRRYDIVAAEDCVLNSLSHHYFEESLSLYPENRAILLDAVHQKYSATAEFTTEESRNRRSKKTEEEKMPDAGLGDGAGS